MLVKRVTTPLEETVKAEHLACLEKKSRNENMREEKE
jgi:hypothetical protein